MTEGPGVLQFMGSQRQDLAAEQPITMYFVEKYSKARSIKDQKTWMQREKRPENHLGEMGDNSAVASGGL